MADSLLLDQTEKIQKFIRIINRELDRRKKLLSEHGVGTIALYREVTGKQEPTMVILMDSYESMKDEPYETDLFKLFMRISREGLSIGVHLIITASRQNNLRAQLYSNFKHQLTLPQNDISEVRGIVGATPLASTMEDIKGRALMKRDEVDVVQFALPVAGDNDIQIINNLRDQVQSLKEMWTGRTPAGIPMVPDELTEAAFYGREDVILSYLKGDVPVGLDVETVDLISWKAKDGNLLYLTEQDEQMTGLVNQLIKAKQTFVIIAPPHQSFEGIENITVVNNKDEYHELLSVIEQKIDERRKNGNSNHVVTLVVYNLTELVEIMDNETIAILANVLEKGQKGGYASIVISTPRLSRLVDKASIVVKSYKLALVGIRLNDQTIINVNNKPNMREPQLDEQLHYYVQNKMARKIKVLMK